MKRICVAGQIVMDARRAAQLDAGTSGKPSNKTGALLDRNSWGRRRLRHGERSFGAGAAAKAPRFATRNTAACAPSRTTLRETEFGTLSAHVFVARRLLENNPTARLASRPASETDAVALFVSLGLRL